MTDTRESKLAKWAQEELRDLRRQLSEARKTIGNLEAELNEEVPESHVGFVYQRDILESEPRYLPHGATVFARLGKHRWQGITLSIQTDREGNNVLDVNGNKGVIIQPFASNSFQVRIPQ